MRVCLFDVDGTLVDSREPILKALNNALRSSGLEPVTGADLWQHVGPPLHFTVRTLLADQDENPDRAEALIETYRREYKTISVDLARSYPGVPELLDSLAGRVRLAVVTSKPRVYAYPILDALEFASLMEVIEGPDLSEVEAKTITLHRALQRLRLDPNGDDVTMIGDRLHDIEAGQAHGIQTIGVTWGFGSRQELAEAGADNIVDSPDEIAGIVVPA